MTEVNAEKPQVSAEEQTSNQVGLALDIATNKYAYADMTEGQYYLLGFRKDHYDSGNIGYANVIARARDILLKAILGTKLPEIFVPGDEESGDEPPQIDSLEQQSFNLNVPNMDRAQWEKENPTYVSREQAETTARDQATTEGTNADEAVKAAGEAWDSEHKAGTTPNTRDNQDADLGTWENESPNTWSRENTDTTLDNESKIVSKSKK